MQATSILDVSAKSQIAFSGSYFTILTLYDVCASFEKCRFSSQAVCNPNNQSQPVCKTQGKKDTKHLLLLLIKINTVSALQ